MFITFAVCGLEVFFFSSALKYTTITIVLSLYHTIPLLANKKSKTNHMHDSFNISQ